jgi:hypothetical protein
MPPKRPDLILSSHIPHIKLDILIRHRLNVEAHCRNGSDVLVQLQLVQYRCLASSIQAQHQQSHFLGSEDLAHHFRELTSHPVGCAFACLQEEEVGVEVSGRGKRSCEIALLFLFGSFQVNYGIESFLVFDGLGLTHDVNLARLRLLRSLHCLVVHAWGCFLLVFLVRAALHRVVVEAEFRCGNVRVMVAKEG